MFMKNFVDKMEYVSPEIKILVVDEDIITNSIILGDGELDTMDEIPLGPDEN